MKVIAAGFPKTGTKSLNAALTILGYNVYDFIENGILLQDEYEKIFFEGWTTETFKNMYKDVDAVTDVPACYFWEEISKAFPDAKIVLTLREDEDVWYRSFEKHIKTGDSNLFYRLMQFLSPTQLRLLWTTGYGIGLVVFGDKRIFEGKWFGRKMNEQMLKLKYRAHNAHVFQNAPKDKLLVFRISEGWEPLCQFLGVPVPNQPFPHKNAGSTILKEMLETHPLVIKMKNEMLISLSILMTSSVILGFITYKKGFHGVTTALNNGFTSILKTFGWQ